MKMKYLLSFFLCLAVSISAEAKDNIGADYISLGEIDLAKKHFMKVMRQSPAEANFYLGEIDFMEGKADEAKAKYQAGIDANPQSLLSAIGLAKVELKSNPKAAEGKLSNIQKENKKDIEVVLAIAKAYLDNGMNDKAEAKLNDARKINKKSPLVYMFEGNMLAKQNKMGEAAGQYEQATAFDPSYVLAYVMGAKVYESINPQAAITMLKKALEVNPDYMIANKYLGRIYSNTGAFPESIEVYKKYFTTGNQTAEDYRHYAGDEFFFKNYDKVEELCKEGLKLDPNNFILNRLLMYSIVEQERTDEAITVSQKFFSITREKGMNYITQDHITHAKILSEQGLKAEAIEEYKKAIVSDSTKIELNKEIALICANEGMPLQAAEFYEKYIELAGENAGGSDYFQLGRYYSSAAATFSREDEQFVETLQKADKAFEKVCEVAPESHLGFYYRARTNSSLDPETTQGLAKPHYTKVIEIITSKEEHGNNKELIEAYKYLAYYYYIQFTEVTKSPADKENIKINAEKILQIDPDNGDAKQLFEFAKQ